MNSDNGGLSASQKQRMAAAEIARKKVLAAYSSYQPKNTNTAENAAAQQTAADNAAATDWKRYHSAWQNYYQKYYSDYYSRAAREFVSGERQKLAQEKAALAAEERQRRDALAVEETERRNKLAAEEAERRNILAQEEMRRKQEMAKMAGAPVQSSTSDAETEETKNIFIRRLKMRAAKKAGESERAKARKRRLIPIAAGLAVMFALLFLQYNRLIFAPIAAYVSPGEAPAGEIAAIDPTITAGVSPDPKLIIPSLNVEVPVAFGIPLANMNAAMNQGVAQFRIQGASAYPGEIGNLVISGHSAGDIYSSNQYKFIFSGLERMKVGDLIYINYKSVRYTYRMTSSAVVEPTDIAALTGETDKPQLILVTCTPLGTSRYRLLIYAEQISPSYKDTEVAEKDDEVESPSETLPENDPTFFEKIWNWLTGN